MHISAAAILFGSWAYTIFQFFRRLGPFGLFVLSALDSSFLFLPFGNDFLLIALVTTNRGAALWILYVIVCALGSLAGALIDDLMTRKAGEEGLRRFASRKRIKKLKSRVEKRAGWAVFTATLLPPPFPFTAVIMIAAALQYSRKKLLLLVFAGRTLRFTLIAVLAVNFGQRLLRYINSTVLEYLVYGLMVIAITGSTFAVIRWVRSSSAA
jgi:membrane protein YqaA with SNARE-associated domain